MGIEQRARSHTILMGIERNGWWSHAIERSGVGHSAFLMGTEDWSPAILSIHPLEDILGKLRSSKYEFLPWLGTPSNGGQI